jgi:pentatricopeptide repeat domain-containing protein 1
MNHYPTAISFFRQLEFNGITPFIVTMSILTTCYCNLGGMTFVFFAKILMMGYEPNVITLTTLMKGMCLNGQAQKALYFLGHAVAHGFRLDQVS